MTLYDDIHQQPRLGPRPESIGYNTLHDPLQRSERHPPERFLGDRSDGQEERIRSASDTGWRLEFATWLLTALLVVALLAVLTPDAPRSDLSVSPSTTSTPRPGDAVRTPAAKANDPIPCSDLDYAYEKC
jgi:hypothetical protein